MSKKSLLLLTVSAMGIAAISANTNADFNSEDDFNNDTMLRSHITAQQLENFDEANKSFDLSKFEENETQTRSYATAAASDQELETGKKKFTAISNDKLIDFTDLVTRVYPKDGFSVESDEVKLMEEYQQKGFTVKPICAGKRGDIGVVMVKDEEVIILIAGTKALNDWTLNLDARQTSASWMPKSFDGEPVYAHAGFVKSVDLTADSVYQIIRAHQMDMVFAGKDPSNIKYTCAGHSLGGATANLYAGWLHGGALNIPNSNIEAILFEPAPSMNAAFAKHVNAEIENGTGPEITIIANKYDPVPLVGNLATYLTHVASSAIQLTDVAVNSHSMKHIGTEIKRKIDNKEGFEDAVERYNEAAYVGKSYAPVRWFNKAWDAIVGRNTDTSYANAGDVVVDPELKKLYKPLDELEDKLKKARKHSDEYGMRQYQQEIDAINLDIVVRKAQIQLQRAGTTLPQPEVKRLLVEYRTPENAAKELKNISSRSKELDKKVVDLKSKIEKYTNQLEPSKLLVGKLIHKLNNNDSEIQAKKEKASFKLESVMRELDKLEGQKAEIETFKLMYPGLPISN